MRKLFTTMFFAVVAWAVIVFGFCFVIASYMSARDYADYYKRRLDIELSYLQKTGTELVLQRELAERAEKQLQKEKEANDVLSDLASKSESEAREWQKKYETLRDAKESALEAASPEPATGDADVSNGGGYVPAIRFQTIGNVLVPM